MIFFDRAILSPSGLTALISLALAAGLLTSIALLVDALLAVRRASPAVRHASLVVAPVCLLMLPALVIGLHIQGWGWSTTWFESDLPQPRTSIPEVQPVAAAPLPVREHAVSTAMVDVSPLGLSHSDVPKDEATAESRPVVSSIAPVATPVFLATDRKVACEASISPAPDRSPDVEERVVETEPAGWSSSWMFTQFSAGFIGLWLMGMLWAAMKFLQADRRLQRLLRRATPVTEPDLRDLFERLAPRGRRRLPVLLWSDQTISPMTCGLLRPRIVLPHSSAATFHPDDWEAVLSHELAHCIRGDLAVGLVQRLATILYWWNFPLYRLHARLDDLREQLCDDAVLERGIDPGRYARLLVGVATAAADRAIPRPALGLSRTMGFKNRISRLISKERPMSRRISWKSRLLLAVFTIGISGGVVTATLMRAATNDNAKGFTATNQTTDILSKTSAPSVAVNGLAFADDAAPADAAEPLELPADPAVTKEPSPSRERSVDALATPPLLPTASVEGNVTFEPAPQPVGTLPPQPANATPPVANPFAPFPPADRSAGGFMNPVPILMNPVLILVSLDADEAGKLTDIRFFNESLGEGDDAFASLAEKLKKSTPNLDINPRPTVQIEAPPSLRFESVQRVAQTVADVGGVMRLKTTDKASEGLEPATEQRPKITISVVYVKGASGRRLAATPVVCLNDAVVELGNVRNALQALLAPNKPTVDGFGSPLGFPGAAPPRVEATPTPKIEIVAAPDVPSETLQKVVNAVSSLGIEHVRLKSEKTESDPGSLTPASDGPPSSDKADTF